MPKRKRRVLRAASIPWRQRYAQFVAGDFARPPKPETKPRPSQTDAKLSPPNHTPERN